MEFDQCVERINVLNLRLRNSEERCQALRDELQKCKQVCKASKRIPYHTVPFFHSFQMHKTTDIPIHLFDFDSDVRC